VLVFATMQGCQFCEKMYHESYADKKLAGELNRDFIPVRLSAEDSEDLLERMNVEVYPTTIIYSPKGKLLGKIEGYEAKSVLRRTMQGALQHRLVSAKK
jgi:thioredoxin-related protein